MQANLFAAQPKERGRRAHVLPGDNVVLLGSDGIDVVPNTAQIEFFSVQLDLARQIRRFGAKPDKKIVDRQAASPSSWKTPFIATSIAW